VVGYFPLFRACLLSFDWQPVCLSLQVAACAALFSFATGTLAAWCLSRREFWGRSLLDALFLLPLVLPPVVTGYVLLVLLGKNGWLGAWLQHRFAIQLLFTPLAAVLASFVVAFPLMYGSAKAAFGGVDEQLHDAARSLGASGFHVFKTVTVPLAWTGLAAGACLSFARALGEFGATIMVAGNILGRTTTVPTAIYSAAEDGDLRLAGIYSVALAIFNLLFIIGVNALTRRKKTR
jgi:molybdate transport system permease protein